MRPSPSDAAGSYSGTDSDSGDLAVVSGTAFPSRFSPIISAYLLFSAV